jgi:hypothetical protein
MTTRTPIKRIPKEKVAILHVCEQKDQIAQLIKNTDKLSIIITGNGNPKDGYMYKVDEIGRDVKGINEKLTGISGIVKELHEESIIKNGVVKTTREKRGEWVKTAMFVVGALSLGFLAYNSFKGNEKQDTAIQKIENLGEPVVISPRGDAVPLPSGYKLKMFGKKDYLNQDTIKKK